MGRSSKAVTLALVIPVFNEEHHIENCLNAISRQIKKPDQVFVVDNNCTDKTIVLAKKFTFVTVLHEKKQHQVYAQATGFSKAKTSIIARIDADTVLPQGWTKRVISAFEKDPELLAISGGGVPYDMPLKKMGTWIFRLYHEVVAARLAKHPMMWGSNLAFRAEVWPKLKRVMHSRPDIWEDYDMSFHLARLGKTYYDDQLKVSCSFRAAHKPIIHQVRYQLRAVRTFRLHRSFARTTVFAVVWSSLFLLCPLVVIDRYLWKWRQHRTAKHS